MRGTGGYFFFCPDSPRAISGSPTQIFRRVDDEPVDVGANLLVALRCQSQRPGAWAKAAFLSATADSQRPR